MLTFKIKKDIILIEVFMKDIGIGLIIIVVVFLIVDFIYTEKNTCVITPGNGYNNIEEKCGILKKQLDIDINVFGRYW